MSSEPTEMAGVAEAETQAAYAWALDDGDDLPTQRLTPRRITSLALASSLTVIAAAGAVVLFMARDTNQPETVSAPMVVTPAIDARTEPATGRSAKASRYGLACLSVHMHSSGLHCYGNDAG